MFWQNTSKFIIFLEYDNPYSFLFNFFILGYFIITVILPALRSIEGTKNKLGVNVKLEKHSWGFVFEKYCKFWSVWLEHFIKHTNLLTCYVECNISKIKYCALKLKRAREIHTSSFLHPRCKFGKSECYKMGNHYHYYYYHYQLLARCSTYISLGGESTWHHSAKVFGIIFLIRYMKIYTIMKLC